MTNESKYVSDRCIILKMDPLRDNDVILDLLMQDTSHTTALARGLRKADSRLSPLVSTGSCIVGEFVAGRNGLILTGATADNGFSVRYKAYEALLTSLYLCDLVRLTIPRGAQEEGVFDLLYSALMQLKDDNFVVSRFLFELHFLFMLGYLDRETDPLGPVLQSLWKGESLSLWQQTVADELQAFLASGRKTDRFLSHLAAACALLALEPEWNRLLERAIPSRQVLDQAYGEWFQCSHCK
jgi:hypothetical protein